MHVALKALKPFHLTSSVKVQTFGSYVPKKDPQIVGNIRGVALKNTLGQAMTLKDILCSGGIDVAAED